MAPVPSFASLAAEPAPRLDLLALALAAEFREVDAERALASLDALGEELRDVLHAAGDGSPSSEAEACAEVLGRRHGFAGDADRYDHPGNSMLDVVLERRRGLPILLSVVYAEVARRADVTLVGVGLPGHFVVGHLGRTPPLLLDPFGGGAFVDPGPEARPFVRPWSAHETVMRMLNNLVATFQRRGHVASALRAAELRLAIPADEATRDGLQTELRKVRSALN